MNRRILLAALSAAALLLLPFLKLSQAITSLPDISALSQIAAGQEITPIYDLRGNLIYEYHSPTYGEKKPVPLSEISDEMIALTITTEDSRFFTNPGFSPAAILRAIMQNFHLRETYSGASTITQQIVKNVLLPPDERYVRSITRKIKEILLAAMITAKYDKEMILSIYLNDIYYGHGATGVEKAAEIYFGKHASELDLAEAAFISGLPQAPNYYGIDYDAGSRRRRETLNILERMIRVYRCIPVESGSDPGMYCPTQEDIRKANDEPLPLILEKGPKN